MAETSEITIKSIVTTIYGDLAGANAYLAASTLGAAWEALDGAAKKQRLVTITRLLERTRWLGLPAQTVDKTLPANPNTQPLQWPRSGLCDRNSAPLSSLVIPQDVIDASYELAGSIDATSSVLTNASSAQQQRVTGEKIKVGPIEIEEDIEYFGSTQDDGTRFGTVVEELIGLWFASSGTTAAWAGGLDFTPPFDPNSGNWGTTGQGFP